MRSRSFTWVSLGRDHGRLACQVRKGEADAIARGVAVNV